MFSTFTFLRFLSVEKLLRFLGTLICGVIRQKNKSIYAMSDVRYPLIKPYHFYFDHTIQSRVVNGTESLEVLLSSVWKI